MITKAVILSIDRATNFCTVSMPLFQNASSTSSVKAEALINIPPGMFNNLFEGDIVFVAFEENALEKPVILGKMYLGASIENKTPGGAGIFDSLIVRSSVEIPATTHYNFNSTSSSTSNSSGSSDPKYDDLSTPKKSADYIIWLEALVKKYVKHLSANFKCFEQWVRWHFKPEHIKVDDGDLGDADYTTRYSNLSDTDIENGLCTVCGNCSNYKKDNKCKYTSPDITINYPN